MSDDHQLANFALQTIDSLIVAINHYQAVQGRMARVRDRGLRDRLEQEKARAGDQLLEAISRAAQARDRFAAAGRISQGAR